MSLGFKVSFDKIKKMQFNQDYKAIAFNSRCPGVLQFDMKRMSKSKIQCAIESILGGKAFHTKCMDEIGDMYWTTCGNDVLPNQIAMKLSHKEIRGLVIIVSMNSSKKQTSL